MKLLVGLVVLVGLLLVADRVALGIAEDRVAAEIAASTELAAEPEVDIEGFPFLTQAVLGSYDRVEVRATDVTAGELALERLDATLSGVELSLADALSGSVEQVPVERVRAQAVVSYEELSERAGRGLSVAREGDRVRVSGSAQVLGQTFSAAAISRLEVVDGGIAVVAEEIDVGNEGANQLLSDALRGVLDFRVPVRELPYGLQLQSISAEPEGVQLTATATDTVLSTP